MRRRRGRRHPKRGRKKTENEIEACKKKKIYQKGGALPEVASILLCCCFLCLAFPFSVELLPLQLPGVPGEKEYDMFLTSLFFDPSTPFFSFFEVALDMKGYAFFRIPRVTSSVGLREAPHRLYYWYVCLCVVREKIENAKLEWCASPCMLGVCV